MIEESPAGTNGLPVSSDPFPIHGDGGVEAELARYLPHIARMGEQLRQTSKQIEESVVGVCNSFHGIAARGRATVDRATNFLGNHGGEISNKQTFDELIENCGATLTKIMNTTTESGEVSRRAVESIERMDQASQQISNALGLLEELAKQNKMLALNARIEAAHAGSRGAGFEVVAIEVASQTQRSREVTGRVGALVDNLRALASATVTDLRGIYQRDAERVQQCQREANDSLRDLRSAHDEMKGMLTGMTDEGALLAKEIGSAVRGMQFQDRVSQRIAHVVEDLDALRARLATRFGHSQGDGPAPELGSSAYTMREEREVAGGHEAEAAAGDVELF
jgi:methyl-accepting chemotaxis protein